MNFEFLKFRRNTLSSMDKIIHMGQLKFQNVFDFSGVWSLLKHYGNLFCLLIQFPVNFGGKQWILQ